MNTSKLEEVLVTSLEFGIEHKALPKACSEIRITKLTEAEAEKYDGYRGDHNWISQKMGPDNCLVDITHTFKAPYVFEYTTKSKKMLSTSIRWNNGLQHTPAKLLQKSEGANNKK